MKLNTSDGIFEVSFLQAHRYLLVLTHLRTCTCLQTRKIQSVPFMTTVGGSDKSQVAAEAHQNVSDGMIAVSFLQTHHYLLVLTHLRTLIWTYTCLQTRKIRSVPSMNTAGGADKSQVPAEEELSTSDGIYAVSFLQARHYLLVLIHPRALIRRYACLQMWKIWSVPAHYY
jgi:hypothetical protein